MTLSNNISKATDDGLETAGFGARRRAREIALQGLYAAELSESSTNSIIEHLQEFYPDENSISPFAKELLEKTVEFREELDDHIRKRAVNWDFRRIAIIDRLVLRMAICEFLHFWDIPPKVSIDEAIELTKNYSTEQSGRFVNGILDAILCDFKKHNLLIKSGRGLQETRYKK